MRVLPVPALEVTNLATGLVLTLADDALVDGDTPGEYNKLYTNGAYWDTSDTLNSDHNGEQQVVFNNADVATTGASYKTFDVNVASQVCIGHDDAITTPSWLSTWEDTGKDHVIGQATLSIYAKFFAAGTVTIGGNSGTANDAMMVCTVIAGYRRIENEATAGSLEFDAANYQGDDDAGAITFYVNRVGGTAGAASCTVGVTSNTSPASTLDTTSVSWGAGDATQQSGTVTPADLTGDGQVVLGLSGFTGASEGGRSATTINITDAGITPADTEYFVDTAAGSDANDGLTFGNAWATIGKACASAPAAAGGDVVVWIETGTYTDDPIIPLNSGTDATHRILFKPRTGDVTLKGPTSNMNYAIDFGASIDFVEVLSDSTNEFIIDGEATFVVDQKPSSHNIRYGGRSLGDNCRFECQHLNTYGYVGWDNRGDMNEFQITADGHGSPYDASIPGAWGDTFVTQYATGNHALLENSDYRRGGHAPVANRSGSMLIRHFRGDSDWTGTSGFAAYDGFRVVALWGANSNPGGDGIGAFETTIDDCILRVGGSSYPSSDGPSMRSNGTDRRVVRSFIIDTRGDGIICEDTLSQRIVHCTFYNVQGGKNAVLLLNNRTNSGNAPITDWECFNCIFHDCGTSKLLRVTNWTTSASGNWQDQIKLHDCVVDAGMTIHITGRAGESGTFPGNQTLAWYESNYPDNFYNLTVADPGFSVENANPEFSSVYTDFACSSGNVLNQGVALTTAVNTEASSTALDVVDAMSIPKPFGFGGPTLGPEAGQGFRINIEGVGNVVYTDVNYTTNVVTLDSPQSWNAGADINFPFNGSAPNLGAVQ